jgi:hypothetical protein
MKAYYQTLNLITMEIIIPRVKRKFAQDPDTGNFTLSATTTVL